MVTTSAIVLWPGKWLGCPGRPGADDTSAASKSLGKASAGRSTSRAARQSSPARAAGEDGDGDPQPMTPATRTMSPTRAQVDRPDHTLAGGAHARSQLDVDREPALLSAGGAVEEDIRPIVPHRGSSRRRRAIQGAIR